MTLEVESKDGGSSLRSVWQRHAALTVYVPECKAVAIRGGLEKLDIENIKIVPRHHGGRFPRSGLSQRIPHSGRHRFARGEEYPAPRD